MSRERRMEESVLDDTQPPFATAIAPIIHPCVAALLKHQQTLFAAARLHQGPTHVLLPHLIEENSHAFHNALKAIDLPHRVYYAAKANNAHSLMRHILNTNGYIDVSSDAELIRALGVGFVGHQIECTGPKNRNFLTLAMRHLCLISADSIEELEMIRSIRQHLALSKPTEILVRISDPTMADRNLQARPSKFGVRTDAIGAVLDIIGDESDMVLKEGRPSSWKNSPKLG